jgi:hypothetical protein
MGLLIIAALGLFAGALVAVDMGDDLAEAMPEMTDDIDSAQQEQDGLGNVLSALSSVSEPEDAPDSDLSLVDARVSAFLAGYDAPEGETHLPLPYDDDLQPTVFDTPDTSRLVVHADLDFPAGEDGSPAHELIAQGGDLVLRMADMDLLILPEAAQPSALEVQYAT